MYEIRLYMLCNIDLVICNIVDMFKVRIVEYLIIVGICEKF